MSVLVLLKYFIFAVCFTVRQWETFGQAKVALKAPEGGEEALKLLQNKAKGEGLASVIIRDAGRTQIESGTATVLGIGMAIFCFINFTTRWGTCENISYWCF